MSAHYHFSEHLDELPAGTVIRAADGEILERQHPHIAPRGWLAIGSEIDVHSDSINKPAQVLYTPQEDQD